MKLTSKVILDSAPWLDQLGKISLDLPVEKLMDLGDMMRRCREITEDTFRVRQQKLIAFCEVDEAGNLTADEKGEAVPKPGHSKAELQKAIEEVLKHPNDIDVVTIPLEALKKAKMPNGKIIPPDLYSYLYWMIDRKAKPEAKAEAVED